jgi:hypothetical protein
MGCQAAACHGLGSRNWFQAIQGLQPEEDTENGVRQGKPVYELVDPDGNVYALQAHEEMFPIDSLSKLGDRLKLPAGWQFRTQDLSEDLVLDLKSNETIAAIGDEFHQYWTRIPKSK